ncbi:hypothetical protein [Candidatus Sororendozoicomonas aggregata]|uniref:hypothetical protein n=1 Tax=Candidatus Sororendozoicomonas aggregata TaxID=3073239 RepID=UPI002ED1983E
MKSVLLAITVFTSTMLLASSGFSASSAFLIVRFYNNTDYTCARAHYAINDKHDRCTWDEKPPLTVKAHKSGSWRGKQSGLYGPDMSVSFECGDYYFTVINRQNFSFLSGGDQFCSTYHVDKHLNVTNKQFKHAKYGKNPGIAEVTVSLKGKSS